MTLRETTRLIVKLVEEHSGYPVQIIDDPTLNTFASIRLARRGAVPAHILAYRPVGNQAPDYLIAVQCGFVLRLFAVPPEQRAETGMNEASLQHFQEALKQTLRQNSHALAAGELEQVTTQMYGGLITHLRSVPIGLRIARWLRESFPELHTLQRSAVDQELKQNLDATRSARGSLLPEVVVKPTLAINAAFSQFWAREYGDPELAAGYTSGPIARAGEQLLGIWDNTPSTADADVALVDAWASALGLAGWYTWEPYQAP